MNGYEQADAALALAQSLVKDLLVANDDSQYGLLQSALDHIEMARFDLEADLK